MLEALQELSGEHRAALEWFHDRTGHEISWPLPLGGLFLMNKAKGIHKPAGWMHALSVREALQSPYADKEVMVLPNRDWTYDYFQEGTDPAKRDSYFTNRALMQNLKDGVPVAVVRQVSGSPSPGYRVLGLASVSDWKDGYYHLKRYA